jgi:hypothetical protein
MSIGSNHASRSNHALDVQVLVSVEKPARMNAVDVPVKCTESGVNIVIAIVDHAG